MAYGEPGHLTEFLYDTRLLHTAGFSSEHVVNNDKRSHARVTLHYFHIYLPSCNFIITHLSVLSSFSEGGVYTSAAFIKDLFLAKNSMERALN